MNDRTKKLNEYWRRNVTLIIWLLVIWAGVSFGGGIILAEPLSKVMFFGVTLSFWLAHQGSILVFVLLLIVYAFCMDRLDAAYGVQEQKLKDEEGNPS